MEGKHCWLPDETDGYTLGKVLSVQNKIAKCQALKSFESVSF